MGSGTNCVARCGQTGVGRLSVLDEKLLRRRVGSEQPDTLDGGSIRSPSQGRDDTTAVVVRVVDHTDEWPQHGRCRSEEHTSELQSLMHISYAVFCLKKQLLMMHYTTIDK